MTTTLNPSAVAAVERGAALFDQIAGDTLWALGMDLDTLEVQIAGDCAVSQFGDQDYLSASGYGEQLTDLKLLAGQRSSLDDVVFAMRYGFDTEQYDHSYEDLDEAWRAAITKRRDAPA